MPIEATAGFRRFMLQWEEIEELRRFMHLRKYLEDYLSRDEKARKEIDELENRYTYLLDSSEELKDLRKRIDNLKDKQKDQRDHLYWIQDSDTSYFKQLINQIKSTVGFDCRTPPHCPHCEAVSDFYPGVRSFVCKRKSHISNFCVLAITDFTFRVQTTPTTIEKYGPYFTRLVIVNAPYILSWTLLPGPEQEPIRYDFRKLDLNAMMKYRDENPPNAPGEESELYKKRKKSEDERLTRLLLLRVMTKPQKPTV